ncbi:S-layer homology domain-containing protein [Paenibacillus sp. GD4]|uniref:S-layer homology domain-containing protein n=1 Tax=Paenibacillus sp. GD4 TaxID=3068890 RepID=UPI002796BD2C|nr:S-layer homology domain-containing protein [Paenibacillus sp. GD4]MDQ1912081.1 S-layer homology domain-containing protein [Paenibacillus sp. GD4]
MNQRTLQSQSQASDKKDGSEMFVKPLLKQKTAQVTVLMLLLSVMMPVLAYAASGFKDLSYRNGTVTGTVYSDVYSVSRDVYLYDPNGTQLQVTTATYATYNVTEGVYQYNLNVSGLGNYSYLRLHNVSDSVYETVYRSNLNDPGYGWGGGGGGGGTSTPAGTVIVPMDGSVSATELEKALTDANEVILKLYGETALLPAKALKGFVGNKDKVLRITNEYGTYLLPVHVLKLEELAKATGSELDSLLIKVTVAKATQATADAVTAAAKSLGGAKLSGVVDFNLQAVGTSTITVDLGNTYISRILPLDKAVDADRTTGVLYNPDTQKLSFVPTLFTSKDGKHEALLKRSGNSIYAVIELNKSFDDISGHWAQGNIELLASKLVVDGVTDSTFEPERQITRAEFAALVFRALGLQPGGSSSFKDVSASDWYAGVVAAAAQAKLVEGYEDQTFKPNAPINREELAAMVVRALDYAGAKPEINSSRQAELLAKFADAKQIVWAQAELAAAIEAGIVDGMTDTTIAPRELATRAQSATMLKRLLSGADFINN